MMEGVQDAATVIQLHEHRQSSLDAGGLADLRRDLDSVDRVTEEIFLSLGGQIEAFHARALTISRGAEDVLSLLQGEAGENTLQHLQLLVERCHLWLNATSDKSRNICELLENVSRQTEGLEIPVFGLRKVIKTLHSLRVSTRIEAAKGYASGAGVLARSLDELGNMVHDKITEIQERSESLTPMINASLEMEQRAQSEVVKIVDKDVAHARILLKGILDSCIETGQWTNRLKERSDEVARSFGEMIVALQFQDITRQRLEHVQKALAGLGEHAERLKHSSVDNNAEDISRLFRRICRLQYDQLNFACEEFMSAAGNLTNNLHAMSSSVLFMAQDTSELSRSTDVGSEHRFDAVLIVLKSIAGYLDETINIHKDAGKRLAEVCVGIQDVAVLVEEIELIGEEMQLLAMNAAISAAHAKQRGAGLDIIAQNIHAVAEEASAFAQALARECDAVTSLASNLQDIERETRSSSSDVTNLLGEAQERMSMIEGNNLNLVDLASEVDRSASSLVEDVNLVVNTLDLKERFQEKVTPVIEQLESLGASAKEELSAKDNANLEALFSELEYCYTMDSEREVHKQFVSEQNRSLKTEPEVDEWAANRNHDLGDNIDLF